MGGDQSMITKKVHITALDIEMMKISKIVILTLQNKTLKETHGKPDYNLTKYLDNFYKILDPYSLRSEY